MTNPPTARPGQSRSEVRYPVGRAWMYRCCVASDLTRRPQLVSVLSEIADEAKGAPAGRRMRR